MFDRFEEFHFVLFYLSFQNQQKIHSETYLIPPSTKGRKKWKLDRQHYIIIT